MRKHRPDLIAREVNTPYKFRILQPSVGIEDIDLPKGVAELVANATQFTCALSHSGWQEDGTYDPHIHVSEIEAYLSRCHELIEALIEWKAANGFRQWDSLPQTLFHAITQGPETKSLLADESVWTILPENTDEAAQRLMSAFALWLIELSLRAREAGDLEESFSQVGYAAVAMTYGGWGTGGGMRSDRHAWTKAQGANARWDNDPSQNIKFSIYDEWKRWQADRSLYRRPRDFRTAMLVRFPEAVDGTLRNWMSAWGMGKTPE
jgi:hypothetical protein